MVIALWFCLGAIAASIGWLLFILNYYRKARRRVRDTMIRNKLMSGVLSDVYGPKKPSDHP